MIEHTNPLYIDIVRRMAAEAKEQAPEMSGDLLARAIDLVLREAILPPRPTAWFYSVHDGEHVFPIHLESTAKLGPCACESAEYPCVHRVAVRLYINCQAELRRMIDEDLHQEEHEHGPLAAPAPSAPTMLPEMKAVVLVDIASEGDILRFTLRDMDDMQLIARIRRLRQQFPKEDPPLVVIRDLSQTPPAIVRTFPPTPAEPVETEADRDGLVDAPREDWCTVHQATMRQNERGWAHKVAEGIWCPGHWCREHNMRYWENQGRSGPFWSHKLEGGGFCSEKHRKV